MCVCGGGDDINFLFILFKTVETVGHITWPYIQETFLLVITMRQIIQITL